MKTIKNTDYRFYDTENYKGNGYVIFKKEFLKHFDLEFQEKGTKMNLTEEAINSTIEQNINIENFQTIDDFLKKGTKIIIEKERELIKLRKNWYNRIFIEILRNKKIMFIESENKLYIYYYKDNTEGTILGGVIMKINL